MALKFLTGIQIEGTPAAPTTVSTAIVGDTIEITFNASADSVDQYQVWAAQGSGSYNLIAQLTPQDFSATEYMLFVQVFIRLLQQLQERSQQVRWNL